MHTAIVHYWLVRMRGGEFVLKRLMNLHGGADVITNVYNPSGVAELFRDRQPPITTWVNRLPFVKSAYPLYMPLMPGALELIDMSPYDLVISSESGPSKWIIPKPTARHVCYTHSPMRYIWDQRLIYRERVPALARPIFDGVTRKLRAEDVLSSSRVDDFVANSNFVASRIRKYYQRSSTVIHPPVDVSGFGQPNPPDDYYLFVGQLVSYKNVRDAVSACVKLGKRLIVVGDGPDRRFVQSHAQRGVELRLRANREELRQLMKNCRALILPGVEDFGIVPVEVLAAGRPVIALGVGGVRDTIDHMKTGIFYERPGIDGVVSAINIFEEWEKEFSPYEAQQKAELFSSEVFDGKWRTFIRS